MNDTNTDSPSIAEVLEKWEWVKKRAKTKKDGAIVAAILNNCSPVRVDEGTPPTLVLQIVVPGKFHHRAIHKYMDLIEWATKIEIGMEMKIVAYPLSEQNQEGEE